MTKFAKLFESEKYGQILAMLTDDDETGSPQIAILCHPGEPLGVSRVCLTYADNDDGLARRANAFDKLDLAMAEEGVAQVFKVAEGMREQVVTELKA